MDILTEVINECKRVDFDPTFVTTVIRKESNFVPDAVSPTGAKGLGQITSVALEHFNNDNHTVYESSDLFDPSINIKITVWYLKWIARALGVDKSELTALSRPSRVRVYAAYNVGIGTLKKLENGVFDSSVRRLISYQSRHLAAGGPSGYLDRVATFLA